MGALGTEIVVQRVEMRAHRAGMSVLLRAVLVGTLPPQWSGHAHLPP